MNRWEENKKNKKNSKGEKIHNLWLKRKLESVKALVTVISSDRGNGEICRLGRGVRTFLRRSEEHDEST